MLHPWAVRHTTSSGKLELSGDKWQWPLRSSESTPLRVRDFCIELQYGGSRVRSEVLLLDVVEDEGKGLGLLAVVADGDGGGSLNLAGAAVLVVLAVTEPLTEIHAGVDLNQRDAVGLGHSL